MQLLAFAGSIQLVPDGTILIHIGLILLMIWVLNRTLFRKIEKIMADRAKSQGGRSSEAITLLKTADEKESIYNSELLAARSSSYEYLENAHSEATAERDARLAEARVEIANKLESDRGELWNETEKARQVIAAEAERMSDTIAANILKK